MNNGTDPYDRETFVKAWGKNMPLIVGGVRDEFKLPLLPFGYDWLLTRETTNGNPTYCLALMYAPTDHDFRIVRRGKIDKTMYGEAGVFQLALEIKERHCPDRAASVSASTASSTTSARPARPNTSSEKTRPDAD